MIDLAARLQAALGAGYRVERELGGGGMSRVFVAHDTELTREVVVKVLPPEMAAGVNAERFRREIQLAASLQHPHIVPLLHAGRTDDLVWYTMPLIEGESLRALLAREGEQPVGEAVRILRDIVDALAYAHAHGVVHRDIKPDNVLVSGRHALVTDFGVAKALSSAATESTLTSVGVALGTPAYMAPEQAAADPGVDHRADIYALGALAYELLTGAPPFSGMSAQQILAAHVTQTPAPIARRRATVPPELAALVMRCLEKRPADRWQQASELHQALDTLATPAGGTGPAATVAETLRAAVTPRSLPRRIAAGVIVVAALLVAVWRLAPRGGGAAVDANVVAVLPFRVAGADPALHYLREGMIDLLAAKLTGEGGPRAADPRTVTSAWRRAVGSDTEDLDEAGAIALAHGLGAGQVLLGGVVGAPGRATINASLVAVPGGATRARASVAGPADSLPALVDALVSELLVRGLGLTQQQEASLTTRSVEALKAYLAGQAAYRRGAYDTAAAHLERAVQLDTTFTLAAFALVQTAGWDLSLQGLDRAQAIAWSGRSRLSERDRRLVEAYLGPRYPEPALEADLLAARERAVEAAPDHADAWYFLGDKYYHQGRYLGYADWADRAAAAFERAIALDSTFAGPLSHMVNLAAERMDTAAARRFGELYLGATARGAPFDLVVRRDLGRTLGDTALLREFWTAFDTSPSRPTYLVRIALQRGELGDVDSMLRIMRRRASSDGERAAALIGRAELVLNRGRLREGLAVLDSARRLEGDDPEYDAAEMLAMLHWDGDSARAERAARRIAGLADAPLDDSRRSLHRRATCVREQWRIAHGQLGGVATTVARLRGAAAPRDDPLTVQISATCAALLEAMAATVGRRPDALRLVERVDSIMRLGPRSGGPLPYENLVLGRLFAALGEHTRGLAAVRRGGFYLSDVMISSYLREEGRLAALAGDRPGAIRAYERYLDLRTDPDPEISAQVDAVRAALARLVGETGGN